MTAHPARHPQTVTTEPMMSKTVIATAQRPRWRIGLATAVMLGLGAGNCADIDQINAPQLRLGAFWIDVPYPVGKISATNAMGEPLVEQESDGLQQIRGDFPKSKLDGKLDILIERDGRTVHAQTIESEPGRPIKLIWSDDLNRFTWTYVRERPTGPVEDPSQGE